MYDGKLRASKDAARGERFNESAPGVYLHKDETRSKTSSYSRFVDVLNNGVLWAAVWEVRADRSDRIPRGKSNTDQWVVHDRSVHLAALWLQGKRYQDMDQGGEGLEVSYRWKPEMEANPHVEVPDVCCPSSVEHVDGDGDTTKFTLENGEL